MRKANQKHDLGLEIDGLNYLNAKSISHELSFWELGNQHAVLWEMAWEMGVGPCLMGSWEHSGLGTWDGQRVSSG